MRLTIALILIAAGLMCCWPAESHARCRGHFHSRNMHAHGYAQPHAGHVYLMPYPTYGGYAAPSGKSTYAYGWFGVKPRRHKGVHHGYYNNYKQWSYR